MADKDDVDETETEETEEEEFTPPTKEEWERTTASLKKGNDEAKKWRLRAQGKDEKWSVPGWQKAQTEDEDTEDEKPAAKPKRKLVDENAIRREAEEAALAKAKPGLVKAAAKDAFKAAGLLLPEKGDGSSALARAFRLLDLEAIDVDEEGDVAGIEDQVKAVKRDYPELFARRGARAVNAGAGSGQDGAGTKTETSANKLAAVILGKA